MFLDQARRNSETPGAPELGTGAAQYKDLAAPDRLIEQADVNKMRTDQGAFQAEGLDIQAAQARALETQHLIPEHSKRRIYDLGAQFATWEEDGAATYHSKVHIAAAQWLNEQVIAARPPEGELAPGEVELILERAEDTLLNVKTGVNLTGAPFRFEQGKLAMASAESDPAAAGSGPSEPESGRKYDPETDRIIALIEQRKAWRAQADRLRTEALQLAQGAEVLNEFPQLKLWLSDARRKGLVGDTVTPDVSQGDLETTKGKISQLEQRADALSKDADALTKQIMADVPRFPPQPS